MVRFESAQLRGEGFVGGQGRGFGRRGLADVFCPSPEPPPNSSQIHRIFTGISLDFHRTRLVAKQYIMLKLIANSLEFHWIFTGYSPPPFFSGIHRPSSRAFAVRWGLREGGLAVTPPHVPLNAKGFSEPLGSPEVGAASNCQRRAPNLPLRRCHYERSKAAKRANYMKIVRLGPSPRSI